MFPKITKYIQIPYLHTVILSYRNKAQLVFDNGGGGVILDNLNAVQFVKMRHLVLKIEQKSRLL